jgi:hypothetical protein
MIVLTRLCYVLLLSGYLENVLVVQPFLQKNVVCPAQPPPQTTLSLASETSKKSYLCWYFLALVFYP